MTHIVFVMFSCCTNEPYLILCLSHADKIWLCVVDCAAPGSYVSPDSYAAVHISRSFCRDSSFFFWMGSFTCTSSRHGLCHGKPRGTAVYLFPPEMITGFDKQCLLWLKLPVVSVGSLRARLYFLQLPCFRSELPGTTLGLWGCRVAPVCVSLLVTLKVVFFPKMNQE